MSKYYVIKNKEGKYYYGFSFITSSDHFGNDIKDAHIVEEYELNMFKLTKNCSFVPITICEGDLEEENRVLKAKLETAEYWNRKYDGLLERVNDIKKAFRHLIKDHIEIINEINGFPLSAEKEEIDEYFDKCIQQAKESEKDERD